MLILHSHIPWVLEHGQWPHGSDWLCEAVLESYLPLLASLERHRGHGPLATVGLTPVLLAQLAAPGFAALFRRWCGARLERLALPASEPGPLREWWRERILRARMQFDDADGDITGRLRALANDGSVELMTSSATHALLPLLARDESIRLHLAVARLEHRRHFGRDAAGCWLPECGYRPRGRWAPGFDAPAGVRRGIDEHLADAGFRWFVTEAHLAGAGPAPGAWSGPPEAMPMPTAVGASRVRSVATARGAPEVAVFIRDPLGSRLVWDRQTGYPGDPAYLEFHRQSDVDGLRYWSIGPRGAPLGIRDWYAPAAAAARAGAQASHLLGTLERVAGGSNVDAIVLPFDTELFGHWWAEGVTFLDRLWDGLRDDGALVADTPERHLARIGTPERIRLEPGTWGAGGDFRYWLHDGTAWLWHQIWALEQAFWDAAPIAIADPGRHELLAQAAREMLLAQASDWPFHLTGGTATDYAERRFSEHATNARILTAALRPGTRDPEGASRFAENLRRRDDIFPDILPAIHAALAGSRAMHL